MKTFKKIWLGMFFGMIAALLISAAHGGRTHALIIPSNTNPLAGYIQNGNYHFWLDPNYPAIVNVQIPKDNDPTKNHYVLQRNQTTSTKWTYTTAGTTNPDLFCPGTSLTTGALTNLSAQSNIVGDFKYSIPGSISKCSPALDSGEITPLNVDVTSNSSGVPGSGIQGAACTGGADCVNGVCQTNGGDCTDNQQAAAQPSCESASFTSLEWIICPVLRLFDGIAQGLNGIIQNLLDFETNRYLTPQVKNTWNIMKNISSALLVIIMLLAVIAQAIGGGPVDAYTLRKILPRLIAAVILIQISWFMLIWIISLVNDLGYGVRDLISAPFGGYGNLDLKHLIAPLGITGSAVTAALFTSIGVAFAFSGITIGGLFLLALGAVLTDFMAFILLVLRLVIVVMAVIFFPIAMLAWILPGTQRYWKMWWDNFIKILMLFPLIMAMVYAGRIFAQIFVNASAGSTLDKSIAVFVLFIGFFGPYWFIPKAFKWGGQIFAAASTGLMNATQGLRSFPGKYAMEQAKANREQRKISRAERLAEGEGRRWDPLFAGRFNYALGRTARNRRYSETVEKGRKSGDEQALRQIISSEYERQDHQAKLGTLRNVAQGHLDAATGIDGRNQAAQRWALDQLATFGDWDIISNMRENGQLDERTWQMFVAKNIGSIHQQAPHLSPQRTDLSQIGTQDFATMKPFGFEEWERQFNTGTDRNATTTRVQPSADPEAKRLRMVQQARRALADERVMASVSEPDRARLERVAHADIRGQSVQVTRNQRGQIDRVFLPDAHSLTDPATSAAAFASIDQFMQSAEPGVAAATRQQVGAELGGGNLNPQEQTALEAHLLSLKGQAGASLQARETYDQVIAAAHNELAARVQRAEQQAVTQGLSPAQVDAARMAAQAQVDALRQRLLAGGLVPY